MLNADDIEDIFNGVNAFVDDWLQQNFEAFMAGATTRAADVIWNKQPDEIKQAARAVSPEAAAKLDNIRKGKRL